MATILDILVIPTYSTKHLAIQDVSIYPHPAPSNGIIEIDIPAFDTFSDTFQMDQLNIYNSTDFGLSESGSECAIPDGVYKIRYISGDDEIEKTYLRVDKLQEKFDKAFMKLDMMECDYAIKKQSSVELNSIYYFIQGAIASANNCATVKAEKLYIQANKMLDNFINSNCGCSNNYIINFK